jgi:hypothetical protein
MNRQEDTIDLKNVLINIIIFLNKRKKLIVFSFFSFLLLGFSVRFLKPKNQKDLYEINYLFESTLLPKESMLSILESISNNKDQYNDKSFKAVHKINIKTSYSLLELSIQSNKIYSIESCNNLINKKISDNVFVKEELIKAQQLLKKVQLSIDEIELLKLSSSESNNSLIEKLFYQNQSKSLIDLYKEKQKLELAISNPSGLELVSKSIPIVIEKFSILKEGFIIFYYGIIGVVLILCISMIMLFFRKIKQLSY